MSDASTGLRFNPSPAQRLLIETPGSQVVRACPGAGKTQSIVERFILRPGLDPRRGVALISFTNAAITAAQERCRDHPERLKAPNFVFGREDDLDQQAVRRLVASGRGRPRDAAVTERVLFALVANRALAPASKLAAAEWMSHDVHIDGLGEVSDDACYRAMDWLHQVRGELEKQVYFQVADLLNLQVDLLFFDTTSTYFETEDPDGDVPRDWRGEPATDEQSADPDKEGGFRVHGKSKDSRDDLPQIVIGLAVTREASPVRVWCWPGNTVDSALIRQVKTDMRDWNLGRFTRESCVHAVDEGSAGGPQQILRAMLVGPR